MSRVVVVGAGIAGLAAAWELRQAGGGLDVTVIESEPRAGGVIVTERRDGFVVEGGPDGFLAAEPEIPALAVELSIADRIVAQQVRGTSRWTGKGFEPLEEGRAAELLGIETRGSDLAAGFRTFIGGMEELTTALAERQTLALGEAVSGIAPRDKGWRVFTERQAFDGDGLVLAVPAHAAGRLLNRIGVQGAAKLAEVVYAPSLTVSLAYRADQINRPLEGTGFVGGGSTPLRACTYASSKFAGRAPDGHVLLRAFLAPTREDPATLAHTQLAAILEIRGEPLWSRVFNWTRGLPRYPENHGRHLTELRGRFARPPLAPLAIAGAGYDGAGVSACVRSGRDAARVVLGRLGAGR